VSWLGNDTSSDRDVSDIVRGQASLSLFELSAYISFKTIRKMTEDPGPTRVFAQYGDTSVGVYMGEAVSDTAAVYSVVQRAIHLIRTAEGAMGPSLVLQFCRSQDPKVSIGVWIETNAEREGLSSAEKAVTIWNTEGCIDGLESPDVLKNIAIWVTQGALDAFEQSQTNSTSLPPSTGISVPTESAKNDDAPWTNSSSPAVLQRRATPKRNPDGSCATYLVQKDDNCDDIARAHSIKTEDIIKYNKEKT